MKGWLFSVAGMALPFWSFGTPFWLQFKILLALVFFISLAVFLWKVVTAIMPGGGSGGSGTTLGGFGAGDGGCDGGGGDGGC